MFDLTGVFPDEAESPFSEQASCGWAKRNHQQNH
jgi:hypothetical protein